MKIAKGFKYKIKYTEKELSQTMFAIIDSDGHLELKCNDPENYILLFLIEKEAQEHINTMNKDFCLHPGAKKVFWYKNRRCQPIQINTKLKKYKSKYMPLGAAIATLYQ